MTTRTSSVYAAEDWKKIYTTFKDADFESYDFETLRKTMIDSLRANYPEDFNDYIESSEYIALVELIAFLGQSISFRVDLNSRNNFLELADRKDSVLKLARTLSYIPKRAKSSSGLLKITTVSTTEDVYDGFGTNLRNKTVRWADQTNTDYMEQFSAIINAALVNNQRFGRPAARKDLLGIRTEQYTVNTLARDVPVYSFNAGINGRSMDFEVVNASIASKDFVYEPAPTQGSQFNLLYRQDGRGANSVNSGFFVYFKQGKLETADFALNESLPNRIVNIETTNVNNDDVWLYQLGPDNRPSAEWTAVPNVSGENIAYNSLSSDQRDVFAVNTQVRDAIQLVFGDGVFANVPYGNFRVYIRRCNGQEYMVTPADMQNISVEMNYTDKQGQTHTLTLGLALQYTVKNSTASETIASIKQNAPNHYYAQSRMINGEDYNVFPATKYTNILKVKSINRVSSGISRYLDTRDVSGRYSTTDIFGADGALYEETGLDSFVFEWSNTSDILQAVRNQLLPLINNVSMRHFYLSNYSRFSTFQFPLHWVTVTSSTNQVTGHFRNSNDAVVALGWAGVDDERYISNSCLIKFTVPNPTTQYFDANNNIVSKPAGYVLQPNESTYRWTTVVNVVDTGTAQGSGVLGNGLGPVTLSNKIPTGANLAEIIPVFNMQIALDADIIEQVQLGKNFGLRYDQLTSSWAIIAEENLDADSAWSTAYAGDTTESNLDASWLARFVTDGDVYTVFARKLEYFFESEKNTRFLFDPRNRVFDITSGKTIQDTISVLGINRQSQSNNPIGPDVELGLHAPVVESDGYVDSRRVKVTYTDKDFDAVVDDPDVFKTIVGTGDLVFFIPTSDGYASRNLINVSQNSIVSGYSSMQDIFTNTVWDSYPAGSTVFDINGSYYLKTSDLQDVSSMQQLLSLQTSHAYSSIETLIGSIDWDSYSVNNTVFKIGPDYYLKINDLQHPGSLAKLESADYISNYSNLSLLVGTDNWDSYDYSDTNKTVFKVLNYTYAIKRNDTIVNADIVTNYDTVNDLLNVSAAIWSTYDSNSVFRVTRHRYFIKRGIISDFANIPEIEEHIFTTMHAALNSDVWNNDTDLRQVLYNIDGEFYLKVGTINDASSMQLVSINTSFTSPQGIICSPDWDDKPVNDTIYRLSSTAFALKLGNSQSMSSIAFVPVKSYNSETDAIAEISIIDDNTVLMFNNLELFTKTAERKHSTSIMPFNATTVNVSLDRLVGYDSWINWPVATTLIEHTPSSPRVYRKLDVIQSTASLDEYTLIAGYHSVTSAQFNSELLDETTILKVEPVEVMIKVSDTQEPASLETRQLVHRYTTVQAATCSTNWHIYDVGTIFKIGNVFYIKTTTARAAASLNEIALHNEYSSTAELFADVDNMDLSTWDSIDFSADPDDSSIIYNTAVFLIKLDPVYYIGDDLDNAILVDDEHTYNTVYDAVNDTSWNSISVGSLILAETTIYSKISNPKQQESLSEIALINANNQFNSIPALIHSQQWTQYSIGTVFKFSETYYVKTAMIAHANSLTVATVELWSRPIAELVGSNTWDNYNVGDILIIAGLYYKKTAAIRQTSSLQQITVNVIDEYDSVTEIVGSDSWDNNIACTQYQVGMLFNVAGAWYRKTNTTKHTTSLQLLLQVEYATMQHVFGSNNWNNYSIGDYVIVGTTPFNVYKKISNEQHTATSLQHVNYVVFANEAEAIKHATANSHILLGNNIYTVSSEYTGSADPVIVDLYDSIDILVQHGEWRTFPLNTVFNVSGEFYVKTSELPTEESLIKLDTRHGRAGLKFHYVHASASDKRIDPAPTNIIDMYVLTKQYDTEFRQWIQDPTGTLVEPVMPRAGELETQFKELHLAKATSDSVLLNPAHFKPLFGQKADPRLRASFKVVKNAAENVTDTEVKSSIISAINEYFAINNWDFGETFFFSELSAYLHTALKSLVSSIVIVPLDPSMRYGELQEIVCQPHEIFIAAVGANDIEIIDSITAAKIRANF